MLYLAGILESHIRKEGEGLVLVPGGTLYETALHIRRDIDPRVAVLAKISNDMPGRMLLESLVHERIFFDPFLVSPSRSTSLVIEDGEGGRDSYYITGSSALDVSTEEVSESLGTQSDVTTFVIVGSAIYHNSLLGAYLDSATFLNPRPRIVLYPACRAAGPIDAIMMARQLSKGLIEADELVLDDYDISFLGLEDVERLAPVVHLLGDDPRPTNPVLEAAIRSWISAG